MAANLLNKVSGGIIAGTNSFMGNNNNTANEAPAHQAGLTQRSENRNDNNIPSGGMVNPDTQSSNRSSNLEGQQMRTNESYSEGNVMGENMRGGNIPSENLAGDYKSRDHTVGHSQAHDTRGSGYSAAPLADTNTGSNYNTRSNLNAGSNFNTGSNLDAGATRTGTDAGLGHQNYGSSTGNRELGGATTNDGNFLDAARHPPSMFSQHAGAPQIEHDYPEDSTTRRHSVSHQEKHILG